MTHFTFLWLGEAISAAVFAIASILPGSSVLGTIFFDTTVNSSPAIYRDTVETISFDDGVTNIMGQINSSGGLVKITGDLAFSEVHGHASGALVIENPTTESILCNAMYLDITKNHLRPSGNNMQLDVYAGTGSINESASPVTGNGTGSVIIANNWTTATGSVSLSGSVLTSRGVFKLYGNTETTKVNQINVISLAQTGGIAGALVGTYNVNCYRTD